MAEITTAMIKELRGKTMAAISLCKEALEASDGNFEEAEMYIRKKDKDKAAKKSERATGEGIVFTKLSDDGQKASMVEIACETDFAANNEGFQKLGADLLAVVEAADSLQDMANLPVDGGKSVTETVAEAVATIGENMRLRRAAFITAPAGGALGEYCHFNRKSASYCALKLDGVDAGNDTVSAVTRDVCMHITSCRPLGLKREDIPADVVAKEKEVFKEEVAGKPEEIQEKILEGKLSKFYAGQCLSEQGFVKDDKVKVADYISNALKEAGGNGELTGFIRFELGGTAVCVGGEMVEIAEKG